MRRLSPMDALRAGVIVLAVLLLPRLAKAMALRKERAALLG